MRGIPFAKRYLSPIGAAKGTPSRAKAKRAPEVAITEKAAKETWEAEGGNLLETAKKRGDGKR